MTAHTIRTGILTVSDRGHRGEYRDLSGPVIRQLVVEELGATVEQEAIVPDEREIIAATLSSWAGEAGLDLVLTTGGTGLSPRDVTPEATRDVIDCEIPGLGEEMRRRSLEKTIHALGSRALAGVLGTAVVINLPGRPQGAVECFGFVAAALPHLLAVRRGPVADQSHLPPPA